MFEPAGCNSTGNLLENWLGKAISEIAAEAVPDSNGVKRAQGGVQDEQEAVNVKPQDLTLMGS